MAAKGLKDRVKRHATEVLRFDLFGVASADDPEFERAPDGHSPGEYLSGAKSVVVVGLRVVDPVLCTTPSPVYNKHYHTVNEELNVGAYGMCKFLEDEGYQGIYFPESDPYPYFYEQRDRGDEAYVPSFSHIAAATAAGLGRRGKVGVVLTPRYGPRQRWISVVTTAPLRPDKKFDRDLCLDHIDPGSCNKCIDVCRDEQSGALRPWPEEGGVKMMKCNWGKLFQRGYSCGCCIKVCPVARD